MHTEASFFTPLLVIVILALLIPIIVERLSFLRIPIVVGEIIAGIIIGKSCFNIVEPGQILEFLSTFPENTPGNLFSQQLLHRIQNQERNKNLPL